MEIEKPRDDSKDVCIENGNGFVKGEGRDGGGGVGADAGKGAELLEVEGNFSVEILDDGFCGAVEVSGAGVVAEAFPEFQDFFLGCGGEGRHIRQGAHPAIEVGENGSDGRLLQHELGDQNPIRRGVVSPREFTALRAEPRLKRILETGAGFFVYHLDRSEELRAKHSDVRTKTSRQPHRAVDA